jgi:hypothetical protein
MNQALVPKSAARTADQHIEVVKTKLIQAFAALRVMTDFDLRGAVWGH